MAKNNDAGILALNDPVVMAHPNVITARPFKRNGKEVGEPKFGASFVFAPDAPEFKAIKAHAAAIARAEWPTVDLKVKGNVRFPWKLGDVLADKRKVAGKEDGEFQRGKVVLTARSKYRPGLSAFVNGKIVDYSDDAAVAANSSKFFFGAEVLAEFNFVAMEVDGERSVVAYLNKVMATGKGTKLGGGGRSATETFKNYRGGASAEDPTGAIDDDEIPY